MKQLGSIEKEKWENLVCIDAVNTKFTRKKGTTYERHYYISSRKLSAEKLLKHVRLECSVETIHWLLAMRGSLKYFLTIFLNRKIRELLLY